MVLNLFIVLKWLEGGETWRLYQMLSACAVVAGFEL